MRPPPSPRLLAAARNLQLEAVTAEVVGAFQHAGVESIVLKGPAVAQALYPEGDRASGDVDLLVAPDVRLRANAVLAKLGFGSTMASEEVPDPRAQWADLWLRSGLTVELHRTLWGTGVSEAELWSVLCEQTAPIRVSGVEMRALARHALAMHVALHAAQHGRREPKPLVDLERALGTFEPESWVDAATLAARLGALPAFAAGLRLVPAGTRLAADLELGHEAPLEVVLRASGASPGALAVNRIADGSGPFGRIRLVARTLLPPPAFMRVFFPLARRGPLGLGAAYVLRLATRARQLPAGVAEWRHARKAR
jgi:hypothetical protein